jgi:hypothetical protein
VVRRASLTRPPGARPARLGWARGATTRWRSCEIREPCASPARRRRPAAGV